MLFNSARKFNFFLKQYSFYFRYSLNSDKHCSMRLFLCCFFIIDVAFCISQNLIPNHSFEEQNICTEYGEACSPMGWQSTVLKNFYYHRYEGRPYEVPPAADGIRYISFYVYNPMHADDRRFVQVPLLCPLEAGQTYHFSTYIMLPEFSVSALELIFVEELEIHDSPVYWIDKKADVSVEVSPESDYGSWIRLESEYTARGGERGLVLGLFSKQPKEILELKKLRKKELRRASQKRVYLALDSVVLQSANPDIHKDCNLVRNLEAVRADRSRHSMKSPFNVNELNIIQGNKEIEPLGEEEPEKEEVLTDSLELRFDYDSAELSESAKKQLFELLLRMHADEQLFLEIFAHTDQHGDALYNQGLSEARAQSVADFFLQRRISRDRIRMQAYGKRQIKSSSDSENRRAELLLYRKP